MQKRWDKVKDRFAGNTDKAFKVANRLAESYMTHDDTKDAVKDIAKLGFDKKAASGIAQYLKAYALDTAADDEFDALIGLSAKKEATESSIPEAKIPEA